MIRYLLIIFYYIWLSFIIVFVVLICLLIIRYKVSKLRIGDNLGKVMIGIIIFVYFMNNYVKNNIGKYWKMFVLIILSFVIFIFLFNIFGLFLLDILIKYVMVILVFVIVSVIII